MESYFFDQDQTQVPCVTRRIRNQQMARELALSGPSSSVPFPVTLFPVRLTKTAIPCPRISYVTLLSVSPAQGAAPSTMLYIFLIYCYHQTPALPAPWVRLQEAQVLNFLPSTYTMLGMCSRKHFLNEQMNEETNVTFERKDLPAKN